MSVKISCEYLGDLRVRAQIEKGCKPDLGQRTPLEWREDKHFLCSLPAFRQWAGKSASLRMEFFYRKMRQQYKVLTRCRLPMGYCGLHGVASGLIFPWILQVIKSP